MVRLCGRDKVRRGLARLCGANPGVTGQGGRGWVWLGWVTQRTVCSGGRGEVRLGAVRSGQAVTGRSRRGMLRLALAHCGMAWLSLGR